MSFQYVIHEKRDKIAYVTLNRPRVYNALHPPASNELWRVWCDFRDDPNMWVAIVTGAGEKAFCAGNDLKYTAEHPDMFDVKAEPLAGGFGGLTGNIDCWKPIIAAVNGVALGGGFELALACDIIVAAEHAKFGLPEPTVGLMAGAGGVHRLPRQIPLKFAMGMLLTGQHITAQEAFRIGLVNEVVPAGELMAAVQRWASDILRCAPLSVRVTKQSFMEGLGWPLKIAMERSYQDLLRVFNSEDAVEGPRAFSEKREPSWRGR